MLLPSQHEGLLVASNVQGVTALYGEFEGNSGGIDKFTDKEMIAQWAYAAVDTVTSAGLIAGMTPDTFEASANTTRAQAVAVLRRFLDAIQ